MEKIVSEISQKLKKCPQCGRPHKIAHINRIPSDTNLDQLPCHLRFHPDHYQGSYVSEGFTVDVYSYPIRWKRIYVELGEKLKEPKEDKDLERYVNELYEVEEEEDQ
jgi:hypothetical protein